MTEEEIINTAARLLRSCGVNAASWESGGTLGIAISEPEAELDEPKFFFGTAAERWAAEVEGSPAGLWTDVLSNDDNAAHIAHGILAALTRFVQDLS